MIVAIVLVSVFPAFVISSGDGNIRLLEEEIAAAIKACSTNGRQRRSEEFGYDYDKTPRIDGNSRADNNQYGHERRNASDMRDQIHVLNATDNDSTGYGVGNAGEKFVNAVPRPVNGGNYSSYSNETNLNRTKRNEPLRNKGDSKQCLSQCIFANLQVVDSLGIPRESEFWNIVQTSVTSQQSRSALRDQIRACFQELQSEAEDNGCSYSNKLERCLMLRFSDRKANSNSTQDGSTTEGA